jgi:hypothetical protein
MKCAGNLERQLAQSKNSTPCLAKFAVSFVWSHSNYTSWNYNPKFDYQHKNSISSNELSLSDISAYPQHRRSLRKSDDPEVVPP